MKVQVPQLGDLVFVDLLMGCTVVVAAWSDKTGLVCSGSCKRVIHDFCVVRSEISRVPTAHSRTKDHAATMGEGVSEVECGNSRAQFQSSI